MCRRSGCMVRRLQRKLQLCGLVLRFFNGDVRAATCLDARGCRSGRERSEDPKLLVAGGDGCQFWWSFAAALWASPREPSMLSSSRRHRSSRSMICSTAAVGLWPSSCPRQR